MNTNGWYKHVDQMQQELMDMRFAAALRLARQAPRDRFAAVLIAAADTDPASGPGRVPMDWEALTDAELQLLAAWEPH